MILSKVVLPQPDGPRKQTSSPEATDRSTERNATKVPKFLSMPSRRKASARADSLISQALRRRWLAPKRGEEHPHAPVAAPAAAAALISYFLAALPS